MTYPCINELHFQVNPDGSITPQPYMQWRHVATNQAASIDRDYDPNGGSGQAEDLYTVRASWTNPDPVSHNVYAMCTRGGSRTAASCRNRPQLQQYFGSAQGVAPADPAASTLISAFGAGGDLGDNNGGGLIGFAPFENRDGERTTMVGSMVVLAPGETYKVALRLRSDSAFWETASYYQGDNETELSIRSGATRLDIYAIPVIP